MIDQKEVGRACYEAMTGNEVQFLKHEPQAL